LTEFTGDAESIRTRYAEVCRRVAAAAQAGGRDGEPVEILVATKYVPAEHMQVLVEAGIPLVGENRSQALVVKHRLYGDAFVWDFIGHLQSRKTKLALTESETRFRRIFEAFVQSARQVRGDRISAG